MSESRFIYVVKELRKIYVVKELREVTQATDIIVTNNRDRALHDLVKEKDDQIARHLHVWWNDTEFINGLHLIFEWRTFDEIFDALYNLVLEQHGSWTATEVVRIRDRIIDLSKRDYTKDYQAKYIGKRAKELGLRYNNGRTVIIPDQNYPKAKCIINSYDNLIFTSLTIGHVYDVRGEKEPFFCIRDDAEDYIYYPKELFEMIDEKEKITASDNKQKYSSEYLAEKCIDPCNPCLCSSAPCEQCTFGYHDLKQKREDLADILNENLYPGIVNDFMHYHKE
jgi:hypothetical protein